MSGGERGSSDPANHRRAIALVSFAAVVAALLVAWSFVPPLRSLDPALLASVRETVRSMPFAFAIVVVLYVLLGFVAAPASLMIAVTFACFGTTRGLVYAYLGMLANGCAVRAAARTVARAAVVAWLARRSDSRLAGLQRTIARRGVAAVVAMRISPVPYTLQNIVAGVAGVRLRDFVIGTVIGIVPIMAVMAGIATQFDAWIADPQWSQLLVVAAAIAVGVLVLWFIARRRQPD